MMDAIERQTLRRLAGRWSELASQPVMAERKRLWTALKDLQPERPMVLFEVWTLGNHFVHEDELRCTDPFLRKVELNMRRFIRQAEEIGDDLVLEPSYRLFWEVEATNYGVDIIDVHGDDLHGDNIGYAFNHPIRTPQEVALLRPRAWKVNRAATLQKAERLSEGFGALLPVEIAGMGDFWVAMTADLFKLIGNDNLLAWTYDAPEALHSIMAYLREDRLAYFRWLEAEGLLGVNNPEYVGSGSPGYTSALPQSDFTGQARLKDIWAWMDSQETTMISPRMFTEFFLPYMAEVAALFGLVYYGCCEPVHDRWDRIFPAMPNIRAVSISPWCDQRLMGEKLGRQCVFSRKPKPWLIGVDVPDWESLEKELDETLEAARDGCLEIIYRDVYRVSSRAHLRRWVDLVRSRIGGARL
jgi:hypothetical protein